ncbi:MAG TPA: ATP-binding protein [Polyangia bacterium]|nr:ATP-binding protein [Polyangia bacterium]
MRAVLIVDDEESLAENMSEIVAMLGVDTAIARDRTSALAMAARRDFDVALIDVRLPDGDGMSLLEPLHARSPDMQVVLVTGNATLEGAIAAVRGDAFAYVLKPVSPPDLLDTVRRALDQAALYHERERLRLELERSERRHRELVESMPALVLALDGKGRITVWNRLLETVTGFSRAEMLGTDGTVLVTADGRPHDLPLKAGGARKVRWSRAEVPGGYGEALVYAVGVDVTGEEEMLRRTLRAERLAAVGTLAAGLAHEVRNPLNSAALQLAVLERRLERGEASDRTSPIIHVIKSEIDRLDRLVREFLAFAKPAPLEPRPVDVAALLASTAELIAPEAEAARIVLTVDAPGPLPRASGDAERLRQVLLNLTRNALEAMQAAGGHITLRARAAGEMLEIDVEDDGPGFPNDLPVFDAFFTTKDQGTGLGLSLAHRIIQDHGGTIRVSSRPACTRFTFTLPVAARV